MTKIYSALAAVWTDARSKVFAALALLLLGSSLFASGPSSPAPSTAVSRTQKADALRKEDGIDVVDGDAKLLPRLLRRAKGSYEVIYDPRVVMPLWAKMRHQVSITLPPGEKVTVANAADDDTWEVYWIKGGNEVSVKPLYPNGRTTVKVLTRSGNRYMFEASTVEANKEFMVLLDVMPPAWMKQKMAEVGLKPGATNIGKGQRQLGRPVAEVDRGDDAGDEEGMSLAEAARREALARDQGRREVAAAAQSRADEQVREYLSSAFKNASFDYKASAPLDNFKVNRVWDDGHVTYIAFETSSNQSPAFWEVGSDGRTRNEVDGGRAVWDPNIYIVSKIFREGVISVEPKKEIKITNKSWGIDDRKKAQKEQPAVKKVVES